MTPGLKKSGIYYDDDDDENWESKRLIIRIIVKQITYINSSY